MNWETAASQMDAIVSAVFDTTSCRAKPMTSGLNVNQKAAHDTTRAQFDFTCTLDLGPSQDAIPRHLPSDTGVRGTMVSYDAVITADVSAWPWLPVKGDRFVVLATGTVIAVGSEFEITAGEEDGTSRRAFYLNRKK